MADSETIPETPEKPPAEATPATPTITVTNMLEPPAVAALAAAGPGSVTEVGPAPDRRDQPGGSQPPTDATPFMAAADAPTDTDATRAQDAKSLTPGSPGVPNIPGYEILAKIGWGGMGVVYKARQLDLNRLVALKMILGEFQRPEQLMRFRIEAETAARVRHANVVQVYDSGAWSGRPYLVLEWVDGGTLSAYLQGKPQVPRNSARTVSLLARALHAAHCAGIVHRDLKPSNILVARTEATDRTASAAPTITNPDRLAVTLSLDGKPVELVPKVSDFGLAKELDSDTNLTETGRVLGTPEYMAPEQASGRHRDVSPATDVYALGVILYQMLTGKTPFHDQSVGAIMRRVIEEEPKPPRSLQPKVPRDLETICLKCLQKDQARRYATAEALANDLDRFLDNRPIQARPTGHFERAWKWAVRRPAVAALSAAAALFFVLGFAGITWKWREADTEREHAEEAQIDAVKERDRAERATKAVVTERDRAKAVNQFLLKDLLATATPEESLGRKITVAEVLQNASARVDGAFPERGEVAAAVRLALANSYRKLGLFEPAQRHMTAALALLQQTFGKAHRDTLAAMADQGLLLADMRKWDEAVPLLRQVVADARGELGPDDAVTIEASGRLALVLQERGDAAEAAELFKDTVARARTVFGPADPRALAVVNDYGIFLDAGRKLPEAEAAFREAADGRAKALAPNHPATLESLSNLAVVLDEQGQWAEAKTIYERVLADKRKVLGREHIDTLSTVNNLAYLLERHGDLDGALTRYDEAHEGFRAALGPDNPLTLSAENNLGRITFQVAKRDHSEEKLRRAENLLTAVLAARRRVLPPDHRDRFQSAHALAGVLITLKRSDEAEPLLVEALAGQRKVLGPGDPETLETVAAYAHLLARKQKWEQAITECKESVAAAEKAGAAEQPSAFEVLCLLVQLQKSQKSRLADALESAQRAVALAGKAFGASSDQLVRAKRNLGEVLLDLDRAADAESHLRSVYEVSRAHAETSQQTIWDGRQLGVCLLARKQYSEAEPLLVTYYKAVRDARGMDATKRIEFLRVTAEQLVKLYEGSGKPQKAAEWREKLK